MALKKSGFTNFTDFLQCIGGAVVILQSFPIAIWKCVLRKCGPMVLLSQNIVSNENENSFN